MAHFNVNSEIIVFATSLAFIVLILPSIVRVAQYLKLFDKMNERKIHTSKIPPVGGIAIFISSVLAFLLNSGTHDIDSLKFVYAAALILFFVGVQDDIIDISARKKFILQSLAAGILILGGGFRITGFNGLFGIGEIGLLPGFLVTFIFILGTVNAWNLIDGIDGQASGLGIIASVFFGTWFSVAGQPSLAFLSFALAGSLAGFFFFNVYGNKNKVFMGDSGSLVMGVILAVLAIRFINLSPGSSGPLQFNSSPAVAFAVLFMPLFDMIRVFAIRIKHKKTPFFGDKNHIHHRLLKYFPTHLQVTALVAVTNLTLIILSMILDRSETDINLIFLILFATGTIFSRIRWDALAYWIKKIIDFRREIL